MSLFKRKSQKEKLQGKYEKLLKESYDLSKINRSKSDAKLAEADQLLKEMEALDV